MPRKSFNDENIARGRNFVKIKDSLFPGESREHIGGKLGGVSEGTIRSWEKGKPIPNRVLVELERRGVSLMWLLANEGEMLKDIAAPSSQPEAQETPKDAATPIADLPRPNAIRRKGDQDAAHKVLHLKIIGDVAALEKGESHRSGFDDENLFWDNTQEVPESTHLIRVRGNSMEPLIMHGQSVMVGTQYRTKLGEVPRNREIVVAEVTVQDNDIGGEDGQWEGVHCKRIQDGGDFWIFTSINPAGETFTVAKGNCRLWHVIGVYFGEKSRIPAED